MISTIDRPHEIGRRPSRDASDLEVSMMAFPTSLDWMAVAWQDDMLRGLVFGYASRRQAAVALARMPWLPNQFWRLLGEGQLAEQPVWLREVVARLQRYADGEPVDFSEVPLATDHLTAFARRVVAACRRVRWGQVSTYGDLAAECGSPGAARAVGSVMAKNCFPLIVPCHRVLASGGGLGGYSAPDGLRMKRRLLAMEGGNNVSRVS
jgi:methylated-DNA-[protein]-cysteine S-methyltransferase